MEINEVPLNFLEIITRHMKISRLQLLSNLSPSPLLTPILNVFASFLQGFWVFILELRALSVIPILS